MSAVDDRGTIVPHRMCRRFALASGVMAMVGMLAAPVAAADPASDVELAVSVVRGATSCGALRHHAGVAQAADIINRSTSAYLDHTAEGVPADDPHPTAILADLGIDTRQVISLQGAGRQSADAIKGALLQGYNAIPDCSYTDIGSSLRYEEQSDYWLVVVVLVAA